MPSNFGDTRTDRGKLRILVVGSGKHQATRIGNSGSSFCVERLQGGAPLKDQHDVADFIFCDESHKTISVRNFRSPFYDFKYFKPFPSQLVRQSRFIQTRVFNKNFKIVV